MIPQKYISRLLFFQICLFSNLFIRLFYEFIPIFILYTTCGKGVLTYVRNRLGGNWNWDRLFIISIDSCLSVRLTYSLQFSRYIDEIKYPTIFWPKNETYIENDSRRSFLRLPPGKRIGIWKIYISFLIFLDENQ